MLPLSMPHNALLKYNEAVYSFLWVGKKPYINQTKLYAAIEDGGLGLPHIAWYHYAFCLKQLSKLYMSADQAPVWVSIEKELTYPYPTQAFITQTNDVIPYDNPILAFSQETWQASHKIMGLNSNFTNKTSLWHNKSLRIGKKTFSWAGWVKLGIVYIGDLFDRDQFLSFEQLRGKYKISNKDFWKYLQLRSCILSYLKKLPLTLRTEIQTRLELEGHFKRKTSCFYNLLRGSQSPSYKGLKRRWERDIGEEISGETWVQIIESWFKVSREMQTRLISYKILNRTYWTPCKMARLGLRNSDLCWRCDASRGTFVHMLYSCPRIELLWSKIIYFINTVMSSTLVQHPLLCLLGVLPKGSGLTVDQIVWCRTALNTGCRIVLRHWKSKEVILVKEWFDEMAKIASYERLCYRLQDKEELYMKIWGPYIAAS